MRLEDTNGLPTVVINADDIRAGIRLIDLLVYSTLCKTKSEARRLIKQGGARFRDKVITDELYILTEKDFRNAKE